jgi:dGTPase
MKVFNQLSKDIELKIKQEKLNGNFVKVAFDEQNATRRIPNPHDNSSVITNAFIRDVDKILNCPFYNRYADKTQVFSLYKNDDIARRSLHVQLVSRIARTIGATLNLNLDLIEAIALGHDLGHTPFGHTGEYILDDIYRNKAGRRFAHNIHSVRVIDKIFPLNVTLQTLDGIACHNGELELDKYSPITQLTFEKFDSEIEKCYRDIDHVKNLIPSTLEGCVVRISDIIAYLGKDRDDAIRGKVDVEPFIDYGIGSTNAEIINNLTVNIIENSYGKPYIKMDKKVFTALCKCKRDNYDAIYKNPSIKEADDVIRQMMNLLYDKLLLDVENSNLNSPLFKHHVEYINKPYYKRSTPYLETDKHQIVVDYIASMTDDYFIELFNHLFPNNTFILKYKGYFEN